MKNDLPYPIDILLEDEWTEFILLFCFISLISNKFLAPIVSVILLLK